MPGDRLDSLSLGALGGQPAPEELRVLNEVLAAIRGVRHGTVTLIVQDGRVVQIERTEKRRLTG